MGLLGGSIYDPSDPQSGTPQLLGGGSFLLGGGQYMGPLQAFGASLLANSGPSRLPVPLGSVVGKALLDAQQASQQGAENAARLKLMGQQIRQGDIANAVQLARLREAGYDVSGTGGPSSSSSPASSTLSTTAQDGTAGSSGAVSGAGSVAPSGTSGTDTQFSGSAPQVPMSDREVMRRDLMYPGFGKEYYLKQVAGPTDLQRALSYASSLPPGPQRNLAIAAAYKAAGYNITENVRGGSNVIGLDPTTGRYGSIFQQPVLPEGSLFQNGQINQVPGGYGATAAASRARASGPATFEPQPYYDPAGNELITNRLALGNLGNGAANGSAATPSIPNMVNPTPMAFR